MPGSNILILSDEQLAEHYAMLRDWRRRVSPARRRDDPPRRQPATRRVFELIAQLSMGGTADAYLCRWDPAGDSGAGDYSATTEEITVADPLSKAWGLPGEMGVAEAIQADDGVVWRVTENPGHHFYFGKLDGALAAGGSATVSIWTDDPLADTTEDLTVYAPPYFTSGSIASASWVAVWPAENGKWYAEGAPC